VTEQKARQAEQKARQAEQRRRLAAVTRAAARNDAARLELETAMRQARDAGLALRPIAEAAGFTPEWTRRILAKAPAS
jgi:hypothetical protein